MVKLLALSAIALLGLVGEVLAQTTIKVMPFGASIVSRCWRANLQTNLRAVDTKNFDFVGSNTGSCAGINIDQDHEGHPGSQATDYAKYGNLTVWLNKNPPDVILMLVGTNDVLIGKKPTKDILAAYDVLVAQMRAKNPKMQIVMSNLPPLDPARFPMAAVDGIQQLNAAIATYAPRKSTLESPVQFVDNYSGFDPVKDTVEGEHPNDSGNIKIGKKFTGPTVRAIQAVGGTTSQEIRKAGALEDDFSISVQEFMQRANNAMAMKRL